MKYSREVYEKAICSLAELRETLPENERPTLDFVAEAIAEKGAREYGQDHKLGEPLTLDELREMPIRDWVWIEVLTPDAFRSKETVSAYYRKYDGYKKDEIFWCGYPGLGF